MSITTNSDTGAQTISATASLGGDGRAASAQPEPEAAPVAEAAPKATSLTVGAAPAGERPAWLPTKFQKPEDMAAAYQALESKIGAPKDKDGKAPEGAGALTEQDLVGYAQEINAAGDLSSASRTALLAKGLPPALIDQHVRGLKAERDRLMESTFAIVGGAEKYAELADWAGKNLDRGALAAFNAAAGSGNPDMVQFAVRGLQAQFLAAGGEGAPVTVPSPKRAAGQRDPNGAGVRRFKSMHEQAAAQRDPRYKSDPAYRAQVTAMIRASTGY